MSRLLIALVAGLAHAAAESCGAGCYGDGPTMYCDNWDGGASVACHPHAFGEACGACVGQAAGRVCAPLYSAAMATEYGVCLDGKCIECGTLTDQTACSSVSENCYWYNGTCSGPGATPCNCDGYTESMTPDGACADKGYAPFESYCNPRSGLGKCGYASPCLYADDPLECQRIPCTWDAGNSSCSGCACECNGCADATGVCLGASHISPAQCASAGGNWCSCQAAAGYPMDCSVVYTGPAIGVLANSSDVNATVDAARAACAALPGNCIWDPSVATPDRLARGQCGQCFSGGDCASGSCDMASFMCIACSDAAYCDGHGAATQGGHGVCTCTCAAGWAGARCDLLDCTTDLEGTPCAACGGGTSPPAGAACAASDGVNVCTAEGQCGPNLLLCDEAYSECDNGGLPQGKSTDLCWCDCLGTSYYGPHCTDAAPPPVMCGASPGAPQVSVPVTSENDRYYKVRLCDSPTHTCGGAGQPPYVDCGEWLPPRQTAGLSIPNATTLIVFVDPECDTVDFEVWRPAAGWVQPILVRALCATHIHPLGCGHFPARVCAATGGSVLSNALCQNATTNVATQCDAATCCATTAAASS